MKKFVSLLAVVVLCFSMFALVGCSGGSNAKAPFEATITDTFICNSYNGEVFVINLDVTNTSKEYVEASMVAYEIVAKIGETTMPTAYLSNDSEFFVNSDTKIAPEESGKTQAVFELVGETEGEISIVGVTYTTNYEKQVEFLNQTFALADIEKKISESSFGLTIDNVLKSDDGDGNDIIIIDMTFSNNSEEATSFGSAINLEIFQNGTALKSGYLPYKHPSVDETLDGNSYLDIQGGNTIKVRSVYNLNDPAAPIQVKAVDWMSRDAEPILEKEIQVQ